MKKLAAGLALTLAFLLWLAPLALADITYYVSGFGGGRSDADTTIHGQSATSPWATMSFAMSHMRQPNTTNGNIILQIGDCPTGQDYSGSSQIKFNPVNTPANGYRYFIIGNLSDSTLVRFTNGSTQITIDSTYCSYKGIWFKNSLNISGHGNREGDGLCTRRRLRDSVISCRISGDVYCHASNVTLDKINMSGSIEVGFVSAPSGDNGPCARRFRSVSDHFYRVTALNPGTVGYNFFVAGARGTNLSGNIPDPSQELYTDSLRVWFCNISGTVNNASNPGELEEGGMFIANSPNASLRGNHWTWYGVPGTSATRADKMRDSLVNFTRDCDTVICVGTNHTVLWWFNESDYLQTGVNSFIDSCYFQIYTQEWNTPFGSSWTYTTFVSANGFNNMSAKANYVDSTSVNIFNHCNFISTIGSGSVFPMGTIKTTRSESVNGCTICYPWPPTLNDGTRMVFKNNIVFRANKTIPNNTDKTTALVTWGLAGMTGTDCSGACGNKNIARKIDSNYNLYATSNSTGSSTGDLSIGWTKSGTAYSSAPGTSSAFKTQMDTDWAGTSGRSAFDSLSVSCHPGGVDWSQWVEDSSAIVPVTFDNVWNQGRILDLSLGARSLARYAGESGSDIGSVQSSATSVTSCAALSDTCNTITVTDYSTADTTINIRFINNGTVTLTISSPISYSPAGTYTASSEGLVLGAGQTGYLQITVRDPSFYVPIGTYYLDVSLPTSDVGNPYYHLNITCNRQVLSIE